VETGTKAWHRVGAHTHLALGVQHNGVLVVGTDASLALGDVGPDDAPMLATVPAVRFVGLGAIVAGARRLGHESDAGADIVFSSVWAHDLGDCYVEAVFPGRAATGSDFVVAVPADELVVTGPMVRNPGPPAFTDASWPLEWPAALDMVIDSTTAATRFLPGAGEPVDREFVEDQRRAILAVAEQVNVLARSGVDADDAYDAGQWPYPEAVVRPAIARAYAHWTP